MAEIKIVKATTLKEKPDVSKIGFGTHFTDHMFVMDYDKENGWHDARIVPHDKISIDPANATLHYGQAIFEGMKAYRQGNKAVIFRATDHLNRLNHSAKILDIPEIPFDVAHEGLLKLIDLDKDWIPTEKGQSLYIRPFVFATDEVLGVSVSKKYKFMIILSPVAAYYAHGFAPVKILVEDKYVRAVRGGLGAAKTPANYAASLHAGLVAHDIGFDQVLWLDGVDRKYIEEVGSMNILFKINGEIVSPSPQIQNSILDGITRRTVNQIAKSWGMNVVERRISIDEIIASQEDGRLEEVFGSGTAAVISPVGVLRYKDIDYTVGNGKIGEFAQKMYDYIEGLHIGEVKDTFGFIEVAGEY
ncbi:MAG: branched-chain amino acid aminotransferase [Selenomonadaceae bacterium]|nr:branched-chain amino acid aminotransferase [Selenomonadaceae bacterium]